MELTLPQIRRLFVAIHRHPPVNVIAPMLLKMVSENADDAAGKIDAPVETAGGIMNGDDFLRRLGVAWSKS